MKTMQSRIQIAIEGRKEGGMSQFTQTKKAKANQTRNVAQGKGHLENKNITRKLKRFFFSSNNLLFCSTNVYSKREIVRSIFIILQIIDCMCEKWSSKKDFKRNIPSFKSLSMKDSLNIKLN